METILLELRRTHKYVGTWKHLDQHERVGVLKLSAPRLLDPGPQAYDISDGPMYVQVARLPAGINKQRWVRAIVDTLSSHGCAHEWDCCGCPSTSVHTDMINARQVRITTSITYNY